METRLISRGHLCSEREREREKAFHGPIHQIQNHGWGRGNKRRSILLGTHCLVLEERRGEEEVFIHRLDLQVPHVSMLEE